MLVLCGQCGGESGGENGGDRIIRPIHSVFGLYNFDFITFDTLPPNNNLLGQGKDTNLLLRYRNMHEK